MKNNNLYFVTEYQYVELIDTHTTQTQLIIQTVKSQMFSTITDARLYIAEVWRQYQTHNYSYPSPDVFILYEDRNKTKVAKLFQIESEDNMNYPSPLSQENTFLVVRHRQPLELRD